VAGTYAVSLGDLPAAYRLSIYYPGGSRSTVNSGTADRNLTVNLAAGARVDIAVGIGYGTPVPTRAYRLGVTAPSASDSTTSWLAAQVSALLN